MKKWMTTMGLLALAAMTLGACGNEGKRSGKNSRNQTKLWKL